MSRYVDIEPLDSLVFKDKSEDFVAGVQWVLEKLDECRELSVSGDCISREDVLDEINDIGSVAFASYSYYSNLFDFVCELPSVEPTPKWIPMPLPEPYSESEE